jgi:hypothetical protein
MSKPSTSGLTASRKNRPRPAARRDLDWRDAMDDRCRNLTTLAGLLVSRAEPLDTDLAGGMGWLIEQEVRQMRALLERWGKAAR